VTGSDNKVVESDLSAFNYSFHNYTYRSGQVNPG